MLNRRDFLVASSAALLAPLDNALAQTERDARLLLRQQGRYVPMWKLARAGSLRASDQFAASVGDEPLALSAATVGMSQRPPDLSGLTSLPALDHIAALAKGRRVVMINEAHVASRHRSFTAQVIRRLRPMGFTHFAAEAFLNSTAENAPTIVGYRAGASLNRLTGSYLEDPVFAEMVREAAALGYGFIPYEARFPDQEAPPGASQDERTAAREQAQADNFAKALEEAGAKARVIVHVGYGHHTKGTWGGSPPLFGERFRAGTGIDPLVIDQGSIGAYGPHARDTEFTKALLGKFGAPTPVALVDASGAPPFSAPGAYDVTILHPAAPDVSGRPGWLAADPRRKLVRTKVPSTAGAGQLALVAAMHAADPDVGIPADQYPLVDGETTAHFLLPPGPYRIRIETEAGFTTVRPLTV